MRVGIVGAGAVGSFVAAELGRAGADVVLVHRTSSPRLSAPLVAVRADGREIVASQVERSATFDALERVDVCLVAVKSIDTARVASGLAKVVPARSPIVSLQNGLANADTLRKGLGERAIAGVVGFNVFVDVEGRSCQATRGKLFVGALPGDLGERLRALQRAFSGSAIPLAIRPDIESVVLGKLLVNLNNGVCAATGIGIAESLSDSSARWCYSRCIVEAHHAMTRAGLRAARVTALSPSLLVRALLLPDSFVMKFAELFANMHPSARSSTLQDLDRGRVTEIDELSGAISRIAARSGYPTPLNDSVTDIVRAHERAVLRGERPRYVTPPRLRARMEDVIATASSGMSLASSIESS